VWGGRVTYRPTVAGAGQGLSQQHKARGPCTSLISSACAGHASQALPGCQASQPPQPPCPSFRLLLQRATRGCCSARLPTWSAWWRTSTTGNAVHAGCSNMLSHGGRYWWWSGPADWAEAPRYGWQHCVSPYHGAPCPATRSVVPAGRICLQVPQQRPAGPRGGSDPLLVLLWYCKWYHVGTALLCRYHSDDPLDLGEALWLSHWGLPDEPWAQLVTQVSEHYYHG